MPGETKYKIFLEALPHPKWPLPEGWYGHKVGISQNHYIYCRGSKKNATEYHRTAAMGIVRDMRRLGFSAKYEPPIVETTTY